MSQQILQLNFKFGVSRKEYENVCASLSQSFAEVPGCQWKIWLMNEANSEAGGIYLFNDEEALEKFKSSELASSVLNHPALSDFSIKKFDVLSEPSLVTRGPIAEAALA